MRKSSGKPHWILIWRQIWHDTTWRYLTHGAGRDLETSKESFQYLNQFHSLGENKSENKFASRSSQVTPFGKGLAFS